MRTAILIAATAAALTLTACNRTDDASAPEASTEAAEASGAAADTAAMAGEGSGGAMAAGGTAGSASGETMAPASGSTVNDGAMAPTAQPGDTAGNNVTETERRLNPPTPQ